MKKPTILIVFILIILLFALIIAACGGGNGNKSGSSAGGSWQQPHVRSTEQAANATATFGAEILEIQLTAIAEKNSMMGGKP
ncbi:hypothetical protein ACFLZW_03565 [Chloroflexota bacterium]